VVQHASAKRASSKGHARGYAAGGQREEARARKGSERATGNGPRWSRAGVYYPPLRGGRMKSSRTRAFEGEGGKRRALRGEK